MTPVGRELRVYSVIEFELDILSAGYSSLDQMFLGIAIGLFASTGLVWLTGGISAGPLAFIQALCVMSFFASVYFCVRVYREKQRVDHRIASIKSVPLTERARQSV